MISIGSRLRAERERLGFKQGEFAERIGVTVQTQIRYEKDERQPDATYLAALVGLGFDVLQVLTGQPGAPAGLSSEEAELVQSYRQIASAEQRQAFRLIGAGLGADNKN